ncbi:MAG: hypothetical protein DHS20C06_13020 [Hyphobacterium sp.]|nr:MAG: hypothetical protein DHS20C06_13020 [Hyphobacterium sp.]
MDKVSSFCDFISYYYDYYYWSDSGHERGHHGGDDRVAFMRQGTHHDGSLSAKGATGIVFRPPRAAETAFSGKAIIHTSCRTEHRDDPGPMPEPLMDPRFRGDRQHGFRVHATRASTFS